MKRLTLFTAWVTLLASAFASLTESTKTERPAVSLEEAVHVTKAILRVQGEEERYYIAQAELFGSDRDEGARWIIILESTEGGRAYVNIMTKTSDCFISYPARDPAVRGAERRVYFRREGVGSVRITKG